MRKSRCKSKVETRDELREIVEESQDILSRGSDSHLIYQGSKVNPEIGELETNLTNVSTVEKNGEDTEDKNEVLSDSLFDLNMTVLNKTSEGVQIAENEIKSKAVARRTSTPLTSKTRKRSQKSPYLLRSPSVMGTSGKDIEESGAGTPGNLTKSIRKRLKVNSDSLSKSPIIGSKRANVSSVESSAIEFDSNLQKDGLNFDTESADSFYGLPLTAKKIFEETRKIKKLFDWQIECLKLGSLNQRRNLIYSLPTSGGKTLVAEILLLKEVIVNEKDAIFVFPFVSIVQEKLKGFIPFANELGFAVEEYAGSKGSIPPRKKSKKTIFLGTIEKIHIMLNSLIESNGLESIGLIVIDELHMLGERDHSSSSNRGTGLEVMLCKIMHVSRSTQIIGMSATLKNIQEIGIFLNAEVYTNNFRPVELKQMVKFADAVFTVNTGANCNFEESLFKMDRTVTFNYTKEQTFKDPDHIVGLCSEVIPHNSCLVFCASKKNCENVASLVCSFMPPALKSVELENREALLAELQSDAEGNLCPVLQFCIPYGVAYHHSGLTMDERKAIEDAYLQGTLCLLCCTSTLAAGVNLPAKRVIIRSPYVGRDFINPTQYRQMIGRAGRTGLSSEGESILIVNKSSDRNKIDKLVRAESDYCRSGLLSENTNVLKQVLLSLVGLKICETLNDVQVFLSSSLAAKQQKNKKIDLSKLLQELVDSGLMKITKSDEESDDCLSTLSITQIGTACYRSSLPLDYVGTIYKDLEKASKHLVVDSYIHLLYICVPNDSLLTVFDIDWNHYLKIFGSLSEEIVSFAGVLGISELSLISKATGMARSDTNKSDIVLSKLYCALILNELIAPTNIWEVAKKFSVSRGIVQNLLSSSSSFCFHLSQFCKNLSEFWALTELLQIIQKKLNFTFSQELHVLLEIPQVKYGRAKQLYNAGFKTLACIATAEPKTLMSKLEGSISFTGCKSLIQGAQMVLNEKIDALNDEAEELKTVPPDLKIG